MRESLEYIQALHSIPADRYRSTVGYLGEVLALGDLMDAPVRTLSLGQRMRVEIAGAMLHEPPLLYLDEPTVGLDVVGKNELRGLIRRLNANRAITVLLVTHDVIDIEKLWAHHHPVAHGAGPATSDTRVADPAP